MLEILMNGFNSSSDSNIVPIMTSSTQPSGYVATSSSHLGTSEAWQLFARDSIQPGAGWAGGSAANSAGITSQWIKIKIPAAKVVKRYSIIAGSDNFHVINYELQASNDNSSWFTRHTVTDRTAADQRVLKEYSINNEVAYLYYRILVTRVNGPTYPIILRLYLYEA